MALTRVGLTVALAKNSTCDGLLFSDSTGIYNVNTNPDGYGAPSTIVSNDVSLIVIVLTNQTADWYLTYTFTTSSGTITAATLSNTGATAVNILSSLATTVWYTLLSAGTFNLVSVTGVTLPDLEDGAYQVDYTISGSSTGGGVLPTQTFSYTASNQYLVDCAADCCISKMLLNAKTDEQVDAAQRAQGWLNVAIQATNYGDITGAVNALAKAKALCECGCGCE